MGDPLNLSWAVQMCGEASYNQRMGPKNSPLPAFIFRIGAAPSTAQPNSKLVRTICGYSDHICLVASFETPPALRIVGGAPSLMEAEHRAGLC